MVEDAWCCPGREIGDQKEGEDEPDHDGTGDGGPAAARAGCGAGELLIPLRPIPTALPTAGR